MNGENILVFSVVLMIFLFAGEPDIWDSFRRYLDKNMGVEITEKRCLKWIEVENEK